MSGIVLLFVAAFLGVHFGYCRGVNVGRRQERRLRG